MSQLRVALQTFFRNVAGDPVEPILDADDQLLVVDGATATALAAVLAELETMAPQTDALTDGQLRASAVPVQTTADDFDRIAKARAVAGEELRFDDVAAGDLYIGVAADGAATGAAVWGVVRYYRTAAGAITRQRWRTSVTWDDRATGWT